jgi:predicted amidohydrolase
MDPQDKLVLALVQMNSVDEKEDNLRRAETHVREAARGGADLVVLPEFFNQKYIFNERNAEHMKQAEHVTGPSITRMRNVAKEAGVHLVATIFEEERAGVHFDTSVVINRDGEIIGKYRKVHPGAMLSMETLYFRHGSKFPIFRIGSWRVGITICYDTFFPEAARSCALNGAELIVVPFAAPQLPCWTEMMRTRALENGVYFAPCNKTGVENGWTLMGGTMIVNPGGDVIAKFDEQREGIISAELSRAAVAQARIKHPFLRCRRPELYGSITAQTEDTFPA